MSAASDALRMAQRLLRAEANRLPTVEVARDHYDEDPTARGLRRGAEIIETLIPGAERDERLRVSLGRALARHGVTEGQAPHVVPDRLLDELVQAAQEAAS